MRQGSWGLRETGRQQRRRRIAFLMRVLIYVLVVCGVAWFSYSEGRRISQSRIDNLESQVSQLRITTDEAVEAAIEAESSEQELRAAVDTRESALRDEAAAWQQRYDAEVPHGEAAVLWTQVTERLEQGISVDRLGDVIALVEEERNCDAAAPSKRIVVKTEFHDDTVSAASFADGRISVTGSGATATDENGYPAAWFDPGKPVSLVFSTIGGGTDTIEGPLPVYHNILVGNDQYRFAVSEGPPDFAIVTVERCDYP